MEHETLDVNKIPLPAFILFAVIKLVVCYLFVSLISLKFQSFDFMRAFFFGVVLYDFIMTFVDKRDIIYRLRTCAASAIVGVGFIALGILAGF